MLRAQKHVVLLLPRSSHQHCASLKQLTVHSTAYSYDSYGMIQNGGTEKEAARYTEAERPDV